jgi:hypothetical protein
MCLDNFAPTVHDVWRAAGLPREEGLVRWSPFTRGETPGFFIARNGLRWTDRWTGEHGDVLEFAERAFRFDRRRARLLLRRLADDAATGNRTACCFAQPNRIPTTKGSIFHIWWALQLSGRPGCVTFTPFATALEYFICTPDGGRWYDYATGDWGWRLDFLQRALGVGDCEARWLLEELDADVRAGVWRDQTELTKAGSLISP